MTLNELIRVAKSISYQMTSGDVPLTQNGDDIDISLQLKGSYDTGYYVEVTTETHNARRE